MEYNFRDIERKWQDEWRKRGSYKTTENQSKEKFYVLDMFPYPSGAGLHVGHPLGYIASDIYARFMRHQGKNVLHPMGYDSFGLPAEQYAIQTGQHPAITTENNIARYREQLDKIGFSYDWSREVRTSDPSYYKWTQWIFKLIYNSWFNLDSKKAESIDTLVALFETNGNYNVNASINEDWYTNIDSDKFFFGKNWEGDFSATDWKSMNDEQKEMILMHYRLAYLADSWVNWCPALGTVLANDEVKDGVSERGGHPVEQKLMRQWSMRITAYAQRLLDGLDTIDWPESIKEIQRNWIGRSEGASVRFALEGHDEEIEVFTTRPDTIFGVSFLTLAPEHDLVLKITTDEQRAGVENYIASAKLKTERDRQSDVKNVSGQFTGAYATHPFTGDKIPVWIGEYVLVGYGTGAVMAVPAGDQRDYDFAKKFELPIPNIFEGVDISEKAEASKEAVLANSSFLNGMSYKAATKAVIAEIEKGGFGKGKINYRMRDAVFSRQRYWGEPFPVYYKGELPAVISDNEMPVVLPDVDKYLPTESGEPPLARAQDWVYSLTPNPSPKERGTEGSHKSNTSVYLEVDDNDDFSSVEDANWNDFMEQEGHSKIKQWETANPDFWVVLKMRSKDLRKNQTRAEELLWEKLRNRNLGYKFRRQHAIADYIVDFVCIEKRLVVEVDGSVHNSIEAQQYDQCRDNLLAFIGFKTIRFTNEQVQEDLENCLNEIESILKERKVTYSQGGSTPLSFGEGLGVRQTFRYEFNTMPGWAGSSWYFLRYMDANNSEEFAARDKVDYWGQVDLYMGGAEHATGHLLYSRFWTKVLCDHGYIPFDEPFKKMINQGMILGVSDKIYMYKSRTTGFLVWNESGPIFRTFSEEPITVYVSADRVEGLGIKDFTAVNIPISCADAGKVNLQQLIEEQRNFKEGYFILSNGNSWHQGVLTSSDGSRALEPNEKIADFTSIQEVEKMSKSKYNVQTPDELVEKFGADTLRCYEMFLGPVEQSKPWDTKGINGVHNFLRKMWRLYHGQENEFNVVDAEPTKAELKTLHKTIKKVGEDLQRFSWNTVVSTCMIGVNELTEQKCNKRSILEPLVILVAPYAPHIAEELWEKLGHTTSINDAAWPAFDEKHLQDDSFDYPVSFNGKTRYFVSLPIDMSAADVEKAALAHEKAEQYLEGKTPKKIIVVPKRIVNIVV